jgi:anti-sigma factor RsiW
VPPAEVLVNCPDVDRVIDAYGDNELASSAAADVDAHLDGCRLCRQRVAARAYLGHLIGHAP